VSDPLLPFSQWIPQHVFTATDLENHQLCPYRFYASAYLKLRPANPLEVELTPAEVGSLVHRLLERFLKKNVLDLDEELTALQAERPHLSKPLLAFQRKRSRGCSPPSWTIWKRKNPRLPTGSRASLNGVSARMHRRLS
jgi:RecB family exonuclease